MMPCWLYDFECDVKIFHYLYGMNKVMKMIGGFEILKSLGLQIRESGMCE